MQMNDPNFPGEEFYSPRVSNARSTLTHSTAVYTPQPILEMNSPYGAPSPAPLLRPSIPGSRQNSAGRAPRLGLAIPPSPAVTPMDTHGLPLGMLSMPPPPQQQQQRPMGLSLQTGPPQQQQPPQRPRGLSLQTGPPQQQQQQQQPQRPMGLSLQTGPPQQQHPSNLTLQMPGRPQPQKLSLQTPNTPAKLSLQMPGPPAKLSLQMPGQPGKLSLQMPGKMPSRPGPPRLQLATPMGSHQVPHEQIPLANGRPQISLQMNQNHSASGGSESSAAHSREGSFGPLDDRASGPTSAGSQYSQISFASQYGLMQPQGTPDPASAVGSLYSERSDGGVGMERDGSMNGLEGFGELSLERGRTLDVEELDDEGWRIASLEGRIKELGSLGEGAGGAVTKCKLTGGTTIFALKIITTTPDPDVKRQIIRELNFNKDCASDHICAYYGAFVEISTATISIAMEFCEGGSLDAIYREVKKLGGRTGEKVLGKIAEGVLNGLTYLHGKKIIHRDIKPSNILLCRNGQVKLCDFGVSGEFGTKGDANTFIGTSYYMAPERITGQSYTITSDVWSTGVTLLEVAQHRFPFPADGTEMQPRAGMIDLLTYIVRQPIPRLKDEPESGIKWSDSFKYFIECCLEKQPNRRASPWKMLEHPWMVEMRLKRVNMTHFLATVWGWDETK